MDQETKKRLAEFLNSVVKEKFGPTKITQAKAFNFMELASERELEELDDDFFFPWQSLITTEDDINMDELEDLILFNE